MNKIKERNTEAVEANAIEGQTTGKPILDALLNTSESFADDEYECVFITNWPFDDKCYQCGKTRAEHYKRSPTVNVARPAGVPIEKWNENLSSGVESRHVCSSNARSGDGSSPSVVETGKDTASESSDSPAQDIPQDAEAELSTWLDNLARNQRENERESEEAARQIEDGEWAERDRIQNERDLEQQAWHDQELLQEETDNT